MAPEQTQEAHGRSGIVLRSTQSSREIKNDSAARRDRIAEMVTATVEAMGAELSAPALNLFVEDLAELPDDAIACALTRCRREIRGKNGFPPALTIADVFDRAGVVTDGEAEEAECRAAWDALQSYVRRHVVRNPEGVYEERDFVGNRGRVPRPELAQRIRDTMRRVGGWQAIVNPSPNDYPHVQRRFYEEYRAWTATEYAATRLAGVPALEQLAATMTMPTLPPRSDSNPEKIERDAADW